MTSAPWDNPVFIVAAVVGVLLAGPLLFALARGVFFLASITVKVDQTSAAVATLGDEMKTFRHTMRDMIQQHELQLAVLRADVDRIEAKVEKAE